MPFHLNDGDGAIPFEGHFGGEFMAVRIGVAVPDPVVAGHPELAVVAGEGFHLIQALGLQIALSNGETDGVIVGGCGAAAEKNGERQRQQESLKVFAHKKPSP
jgi:hypothetical protein